MRYLIANWKQNKNSQDVKNWFDYLNLTLRSKNVLLKNIQIVICPSFAHLALVKNLTQHYTIKVGAQDISKYPNGKHTGEVGVDQVKEYCDYVILGHSERRQDGESVKDVNDKIKLAQSNGITPVVCFSKPSEIEEAKKIIDFGLPCKFAYEPLYAIGTGNAASLSEIISISKKTGIKKLIYGGSVNSGDIKEYTNCDNIEGFLVGTASLKPSDFVDIVENLITVG